MTIARLAVLLVTASSLLACGPAQGPAARAAQPGPAPDAPQVIKTRVDEIAAAKVYDAAGRAATCAPPIPTCPPVAPDMAFQDRCRLAGFQVRACGCDALCSGDVSKARPAYDLAGNPTACAPPTAGCEPPPASAALQDACAEKGHRLQVCGCAWLCSGNPR
jgi:hypothetical protein